MNVKKKILQTDDLYFQKWTLGINKIVQDTTYQNPRVNKTSKNSLKRQIIDENFHIHYFSSTKKNFLFETEPVCYLREKKFYTHLKNLKKGKYNPDIVIDLHGLTKNQAKNELGKLFYICQTERLRCIGIIYGHGKNILKSHIPFWLSQHPNVIVFHTAPKKFGSNAALFVLIEIY